MMAEPLIERLQPVNEGGDLPSRKRAARCLAKMGAAAEGPVLVNRAAALRSQQGAVAAGVRLHGGFSRSPRSLRRIERLRPGHERSFSSQAKAAASGAKLAIAGQGDALGFGIDGRQFGLVFGCQR